MRKIFCLIAYNRFLLKKIFTYLFIYYITSVNMISKRIKQQAEPYILYCEPRRDDNNQYYLKIGVDFKDINNQCQVRKY